MIGGYQSVKSVGMDGVRGVGVPRSRVLVLGAVVVLGVVGCTGPGGAGGVGGEVDGLGVGQSLAECFCGAGADPSGGEGDPGQRDRFRSILHRAI